MTRNTLPFAIVFALISSASAAHAQQVNHIYEVSGYAYVSGTEQPVVGYVVGTFAHPRDVLAVAMQRYSDEVRAAGAKSAAASAASVISSAKE
jgi:predicted aconitase